MLRPEGIPPHKERDYKALIVPAKQLQDIARHLTMSSAIPLYYLCADCGGTKTSIVICDSKGEEVSRANGGPSNLSYLGKRRWQYV